MSEQYGIITVVLIGVSQHSFRFLEADFKSVDYIPQIKNIIQAEFVTNCYTSEGQI